MTKKQFWILFAMNACLFVAMVMTNILYITEGTLAIKSLASSVFVLTSLFNLILMLVHKKTLSVKFMVILLVGQVFAMLGDIFLEIEFIIGAILFAIGHVFYFVSYCFIKKFKWTDLIYIAITIGISLTVIFLSKIELGSMMPLILAYAIIISCMLGKSATLIAFDWKIGLFIFSGSLFFYLSDMFLMFNIFGNMGRTFGILCLAFYYPAEYMLALSIAVVGLLNKKKEDSQIELP